MSQQTHSRPAGSVAAGEWADLMETLAPLGERIVGMYPEEQAEDPQFRAEIYRKLYSTIAHGFFGAVYADPAHPDFIPYFCSAFNYLVANPDDVYYGTPVDGDGSYRITGYRGSVLYVDVGIGSGTLVPEGRGAFGQTMGTYYLDDLTLGEDGFFDVLLSNARPEGYDGDWWEMDPRTTYVLVRQVSYDWLNEEDARMAIERLDRPAAKRMAPADEIQARLRQVGEWAESWAKIWIGRVDDLVNELRLLDLDDLGGVADQAYWEGSYLLDDDEALIIETDMPKEVRYWNVQVGDPLWQATDYINCQTNLNGVTATLDGDGKFRAVVAHADPGVANWLDTAGYRKGYIFGRWTHCSDYPHPTIAKVALADVRDHLPGDTPTVSADEREESLRLRRRGAQLRRRW